MPNIISISPAARRILARSRDCRETPTHDGSLRDPRVSLMLSSLRGMDARLELVEKRVVEQAEQPGPNPETVPDERDQYGLGRFDPSVGTQAQSTQEHPFGGESTAYQGALKSP
jgi:hypothetical protein